MVISVNLGALKENLKRIREKIGQNVGFTLMVKADAYNHGVERVAPAAKPYVDQFGVATGKEGAFLRLLGIEKRILVTAFTESDFRDAEFYGLTPVFGTLKDLKRFASNVKEFDVALDTGMCRTGLNDQEAQEAAEFLIEKGLVPRGISTHLAYTDGWRDVQLQRFRKMRSYFKGDKIKLHIANSDAALSDAKYRLDEVRVGIAAYGGVPKYGFESVMRVTAPVEFVKKVKRGDRVGYDGLYEMPADGELAFVKAGYYDGVPRAIRGAKLIINGAEATVAGNVSMDSLMLDVTGLQVKEGDEVEYLSALNSAERLAEAADTIAYEILTNLKGRHKRFYYGETNDTKRNEVEKGD